MKKIFLSSACALALASGAFALNLDFSDNTKYWYDQIVGDKDQATSLSAYGFAYNSSDNGAIAYNKVKTIIGNLDNANDSTTIVGALAAKVTATSTASYAKDANKIKDSFTLESNKGIKNLLKDYKSVKDALAKNQAVTEIKNYINNGVTKFSDATGSDVSTKLLKENLSQAQLEKLANIVVYFSADDKKLTNAKAMVDANGKYKQDTIEAAVKNLFASSAVDNYPNALSSYDSVIASADLNSDKTALEALEKSVKAAVNDLVDGMTDGDDKTIAQNTKAQLADAAKTLDDYAQANVRIISAKAVEAQALEQTNISSVVSLTNSYANLLYVNRQSGGEYVATIAQVKQNLKSAIMGVVDKDHKDLSETDKAKELSALTDGTSRLTLSQAKQWAEHRAKLPVKQDEPKPEGNGNAQNGDGDVQNGNGGSVQDGASAAAAPGAKAALIPAKPAADPDPSPSSSNEITAEEHRKAESAKSAIEAIQGAINSGSEITEQMVSNLKTAFDIDSKSDLDTKFVFKSEAITGETAGYNTAQSKVAALTDDELNNLKTAHANYINLVKQINASSSKRTTQVVQSANDALAGFGSSINSAVVEQGAIIIAQAFNDENGNVITEQSLESEASTEATAASTPEQKSALRAKYGIDASVQDADLATAIKAVKIQRANTRIQEAANQAASMIASSQTEQIAQNAQGILVIQLNNLNKRLGELRGLDGEVGVWMRTWGGRMSADSTKVKYYSTQIGADKKSTVGDGSLYLGLLAGYDKASADAKSDAYSAGIYASYLANSGYFVDGIAKYVSTKHKQSGYQIKSQKSIIASAEVGYRIDAQMVYVEPSVEFITGHISAYEKSRDKVSITADSFTPMMLKPQVFVGGSVDAFAYRAGIGGVFSLVQQNGGVQIRDIVTNISGDSVTADGKIKLSKNNHGFVSLGGAYKFADKLRANLSLERSIGGDIKNDYEVNMTLRYEF